MSILFVVALSYATEIKNNIESSEMLPAKQCFSPSSINHSEQAPFDLAMVGADLARDYAKKYSKRKVRVATVEPINLDAIPKEIISADLLKCKAKKVTKLCFGATFEGADQESHGEGVVDLAIGRSKNSASHMGVLVMVGDPEAGQEKRAQIQNFFPPLAEKYKPEIVLSSVPIINGKDAKPWIKNLGEKQIVLSNTAGNHYPGPAHPLTNINPDTIVTGAICDRALVCSFSAEGSDVTILSTTHAFTSQAQPIVAGSLINVMSMLPGITPKELKRLLKNSALPAINTESVSNDFSESNGKGVLNAYKMARVAQRLQNGWPKNRDKLNGVDAYNFESEVEKILSKVGDKSVCDQNDLNELRAAFFLNPSDSKAQQLILSALKGSSLNREYHFVKGLTSSIPLQALRDLNQQKLGPQAQADIIRRYVQLRSWSDVERFINREDQWLGTSWPSQLEGPMQDAISKFGKKEDVESLIERKIKSGNERQVNNAMVIGARLQGLDNTKYYRLCLRSNSSVAFFCASDYYYSGSKEIQQVLAESKAEEKRKICELISSHLINESYVDQLRDNPGLIVKGCISP